MPLYFLLSLFLFIIIIRRRIDFLSVAAVSFILYTSNCLVGEVWIFQSGYNIYEAEISAKTYFLVCNQLIIIFAYLFMEEKGIKLSISNTCRRYRIRLAYSHLEASTSGGSCYWAFLFMTSAMIVWYTIFFRIGLGYFLSYAEKGMILSETNILFGLSMWSGMICFFYYYSKRNRMGTIASGVIILITVLLGSRAYLASVMVGVLVVKSYTLNERKIDCRWRHRNRKIILLGILMVFFLLIYKLIYKEVRAGDFEGMIRVLSSTDTWSSILDVDELRIVFANYNYSIENQLDLHSSDIIARIVSVIPFANDGIPTYYPMRFSQLLQERVGTTYGLANSFWGECYAMGRGMFVLTMTVVWISFIRVLNNRIIRKKSPFLITIASYLSFYIHRLDWTQVMGCIKTVFLFYCIKTMYDGLWLSGDRKVKLAPL